MKEGCFLNFIMNWCKNLRIFITVFHSACRAYKSEYRKKFRPFSQYQYVDGKFLKVKAEEATAAGTTESPNNWYKEVIELRKQAGQYRVIHET